MMDKALFSSATAEWETPHDLFAFLDKRFGFEVDVCATAENAKCARWYDKKTDGLSREWAGRCWMNPPYGREIGAWVRKARLEAERGALVVGLLPARTDTKWWHENVTRHADVCFIAGRLRFGAAKNSAPFPSAVVVWWGGSVLNKKNGTQNA